jgi:lipoate-protein ligase A
MLDIVLPRGHPLVIDDVGQSYRWLARALQAELEARGAKLRAVTPREAATLPISERAAARFACFAGTGSYELVTADERKLVGLAQRRRGGAALLQAAAYVAPPRLDVAAWLGLPRDQEERLRERLLRIATLEEVAPGFADAPPVAMGLVP